METIATLHTPVHWLLTWICNWNDVGLFWCNLNSTRHQDTYFHLKSLSLFLLFFLLSLGFFFFIKHVCEVTYHLSCLLGFLVGYQLIQNSVVAGGDVCYVVYVKISWLDLQPKAPSSILYITKESWYSMKTPGDTYLANNETDRNVLYYMSFKCLLFAWFTVIA